MGKRGIRGPRLNLNDIPISKLAALLERAPVEVVDRGCHIWLGVTNAKGYGKVSFKNRYYAVHRISYVIANGHIPNGLDICHRCDTPLCFNAGHLFAGTRADNMQDCIRKGRTWCQTHPEYASKGDHHLRSKLTSEAVREIRAGGLSRQEYAEKFGVIKGTIVKVIRRDTWKHLS